VPKKATVVGVLGEKDLLLPGLVHEALAANGRAKYGFTLLQLALAHANAADGTVPDLRSERELVGIGDARFDRVIGGSRRGHGDEYRVPLAKVIVEQLFADIDAMIAPLRAVSTSYDPKATAAFEGRCAALKDSCLPRDEDVILAEALVLLTSSDRSRGDSAHLLVFDLHKAVDALAASFATDDVDGAKAYGLNDADRPLVAAFMRGVHATEALKFTHPGLETMAIRSGDVLVIENDIGETSAHVLVIRIDALRAIVTNTDVHLQRLAFFRRMLDGFPMSWTDVRSRSARELQEVGLFYECIGTLEARDREEFERFLARLGSRIVFLIDWNRARKALRAFVPKAASIELLEWAANEDVGHRGWLEMGGEQLVLDAMAAVIRIPVRFGERLDDVLEPPAAAEFLRFVLRTCSVGLRQKRSRSLMRAESRAALSTAVQAGGDRLLEPVVAHAVIVADMASALRDQLRRLAGGQPAAADAFADSVKDSEHRADEIVITLRTMARRMPEAAPYRDIVEIADDAADAIEEAAFSLSLLPCELPPLFGSYVGELGDLVVSTTDAYAACTRSARRGRPDEVHGVLDAFDVLSGLEHRMDNTERRFVAALAHEPEASGKVFAIGSRIADQMEHAVDALTHAALLLRDHVTAR